MKTEALLHRNQLLAESAARARSSNVDRVQRAVGGDGPSAREQAAKAQAEAYTLSRERILFSSVQTVFTKTYQK